MRFWSPGGGAGRAAPTRRGDLAAPALISDQGPSVGALGFCVPELFKDDPLGLGAISSSLQRQQRSASLSSWERQ